MSLTSARKQNWNVIYSLFWRSPMARELGVYSTGEIEWKFATKKPTPSFWQAGCPSCRPTNSVKALKGIWQDLCLDYISIIEQIFETVGFSMPEKLGPGKSDRVKVKVHAFDIVPLRSESPPQKRSGMARVLKGFHSFTCTPTRSSAIGMSHICLCLPSRSWYSFADPGGMEGWVDLVRSSPG